MINTFVMSGEVLDIDVNNKPTRKGPAAVITIQYGPSRERTDQPTQFVHIAMIRLPPFVYEKVKNQVAVGCTVDIVGNIQGLVKSMGQMGFRTIELVAARVQVVGAEDTPEDDEASSTTAVAEVASA